MVALLLTLFSFSLSPELPPDSVKLPVAAAIESDTTQNKYVEIDNIFIIGNRRTREKIILRELSITKGQLLFLPDLQQHLVNDKNKVMNTRLFNAVEISLLELSPEKVDVIVRVEERWYTFPIPIFELIDRNFNDWWVNRNHDINRIKYGLRFQQHNMRGSNEKLGLIAQFGITRRYGLSYSIPYLDRGQKHGLRIQANYKENINQAYKTEEHKYLIHNSEDLLYQEFNAEIKYSYRGEFYTTHEATIGYENARINDTINLLNPDYFNNNQKEQQFFVIKYRFRQDKRDFVSYPLKGYVTSVSLEKRGLGIFDDLNLLSIDLSYAKYFDLGRKFYLSNYSNAYISAPNKQPYANYYGMGYGGKLVRGYETYVIEGTNYFLNKTTLKKTLLDGKFKLFSFFPNQFRTVPYAIYFKTFFDFGYVTNYPDYELNNRLTNKWIYSGGIGIDIVTYYDFVIRLEYSLNAQNETWFNFDIKSEF